MTGRAITLIGAGRMGTAMATGWLAADPSQHISIYHPRPRGLVQDWADAGRVTLNPARTPADILVIGVKPQIYPSVLDELKDLIDADTLILSVMAGVKITAMEAALGTSRIIRAMPNTPGAIGQGITLLAPSAAATDADIAVARDLLSPLGAVEGPMTEDMMIKAMTLSGCGPAYVFLLAEVMAEAGAKLGLPADMAARLGRATVEGAAALMAGSDSTPADLRKAVTSPGGVTKAALDVLMRSDAMPSVMEEALRAALARDEELSR